ncbi:hypothetical protein L914_18050 [Phytophthora nicotianae]|uniref:Uncharacterized protein n=1 Tax=Phytophthora nicotianae TaxID=4792 RepID=W2MH30_PHYNI|nr:hypothetical protein L914_18050 [Phytophthora nicotianae]
MVTPQRSSQSPYNVDMATFLNCNRDYVDITQCPKLSTNAAAERLPSNVLVNITQDLDDEFGSLENIFSAASMDLGLSDNEEGTEGLPHQERAGQFRLSGGSASSYSFLGFVTNSIYFSPSLALIMSNLIRLGSILAF